MSEAEFRMKRRQKFLTERYFQLNLAFSERRQVAALQGIENLRAQGNLEPAGQNAFFQRKLELLKLHYTAGRPIEELLPLYSDAVEALGSWNEAERRFVGSIAQSSGKDLRGDATGLIFADLGYFQMALDVASVGVLLGQGKSVRRIAGFVERYRGTDLLFESIIAPAVDDPRDNTDFFHVEPYDPLIDAFYTATTPDEAVSFMKKYLDGWYKAFEDVPWHNGHLKAVEGEYMPYYGYWAFEAAAVCVIHGIDDSSFSDHLIYPKDLADWARANQSLARLKPGAIDSSTAEDGMRLRCAAGQSCPQAGWWSTPARTNSRRHFAQGEAMPEVGGDYGATIWQWDDKQS